MNLYLCTYLTSATYKSNKWDTYIVDNSILKQDEILNLTKYEKYTGNDPGLECIETISLGRVGGDGIEDVDENKEKSNEESHPPLN